MKLFHGDCLDIIKTLEPNSVDLVFLDLPYGQTNCEWDNKIDLNELWKQLKRLLKLAHHYFLLVLFKLGHGHCHGVMTFKHDFKKRPALVFQKTVFQKRFSKDGFPKTVFPKTILPKTVFPENGFP